MQTVKAKTVSSYPWLIRLFFWKQKRKYGRILEPGLLWGRSPAVFATLALLYGAMDRRSSPISPALRSLVTVRVSQINHCAFCVDINSATLTKRGVSMEKVAALSNWHEANVSGLFSPEERLALEYAEAMTLNKIDDDLRARLKEQWNDDAIVELTGLIAFQNMSSKFNAALDIPAQGFCRLPVASDVVT
ncbi:MAG TPA: carboxymuconolactone decarboxylase family protein [Acidobacteriaceae bacterium]|nr:carboxymuconolactone decarboxylase family protein [Acidobacteriaceae bacterium]